jgi:hypothetical protein
MLKKASRCALTSLRGSYGPGKSCSGSSGRAGEKVYDSPQDTAVSPARTDLALLIRHAMRLVAALP